MGFFVLPTTQEGTTKSAKGTKKSMVSGEREEGFTAKTQSP
jgi:hypothetical protein